MTGSPEAEVVRARYGFGIGLDEVVWMDRDVPRLGGDAAAPDPVLGTSNGTIEGRYFFAQNLIGNVVAAMEDRATSSDSLTVVERYTYAAYGGVGVDRGVVRAVRGVRRRPARRLDDWDAVPVHRAT